TASTAGTASTAIAPDPDEVVFPDGLKTTVAAVRARFLQPLPHLPPAAAGRPPLPPWAIAWSAGFSAALDGVWLAGDSVVVACADGEVVGIERASGRRRWVLAGRTITHVMSNEQEQGAGQVLCAARPAVVDGVVVLCRGDRLDAFRVGDGALLWSSTLIAAQHVVACAGLVVAWDDRSGIAMGFAASDGRLRWRRAVPEFDQQHAASALEVDGGTVLVMGRHAALLDGASGAVCWEFTTAHLTARRPALTTAVTPTPVIVGNPRWGRRGYVNYINQGSYGQPALAAASDAWYHVAIGRLRSPQATAILAAGQLVVGDGGGSLAVPLAMPLRSTDLPSGSVLGACGARLVIINGTTASIVDLAKSGEVVAAIDCALLGAAPTTPNAPGAEDVLGATATTPWLSGTCVGRLAWLSGPGGVLAIFIERGVIAVQTTWPDGVEVLAGRVPAVQRSPAGVQFGGTPQLRIGDSGAADDEVVVLPAGTRRLVALTAQPAKDAPGTGHGR
nr:PQQ-binding-like beta-propeller repeat protein [Planctomycetota bacterium]